MKNESLLKKFSLSLGVITAAPAVLVFLLVLIWCTNLEDEL